jgi:hypothetical protein
MEKTIEATRIAPHGLFYMENAGGTHSTATPPTARLMFVRYWCGFALEEEKGADWTPAEPSGGTPASSIVAYSSCALRPVRVAVLAPKDTLHKCAVISTSPALQSMA